MVLCLGGFSMVRTFAVLCGLVLTVTLLPMIGPVVAPAAAAARALDRQTATLTTSIGGMPTTSDPGRRIRRAEVEVVHRRSQPGVHVSAAVTLMGVPGGNPDSELVVGVGWLSGSTCEVAATASLRAWAADGDAVRRPGQVHPAPSRLWDCALVLVEGVGASQGQYYDAMVGRLSNRYVESRPAISRVEVLGKKQARLRLVRGATQHPTVAVTNTGGLTARDVVITGAGKGVRVKRTVVGTVGPGVTVSVQVPITLKGKAKRTKVRLTVRDSGAGGVTRVVPVRRIQPPSRPAAGKWRSADKTFTFRVKNGAITEFRGVNMRMRCASPGSFPTYRNVSLTFPRTKVPRHGILGASRRYEKGDVRYGAHLVGKISGKRMVSGKFRYVTGPCSVNEGFTAKRIGR